MHAYVSPNSRWLVFCILHDAYVLKHFKGRFYSWKGVINLGTPLADPGGGGPGARAPPLDPKFWGPRIEHFGALSNFFLICFASLRSAYFFFNILLFFTIKIQKFSSLGSLGISFLI